MSQWKKDVLLTKRKSYTENPIASFKLIKRSVLDIDFYIKAYPGLLEKITNSKFVFDRPHQNDLMGAIKGLVRLQKAYNLTAIDLYNGIVDGINTGVTLTVHDIFTIGQKLSEMKGENYYAEEFLQLTLDQLYLTNETDVSYIDVIESMFIFHLKNNDFVKAEGIIKNLKHEEIIYLTKKHWKIYFNVKTLNNPRDETFDRNGLYSKDKEQILLRKVCRGEVKKSPKEESSLTCRYHSTNAFTKLAPFKVQVANENPEILLFINVLVENEILIIEKLFKKSETSPALVINYTDASSSYNLEFRVADLVWFDANYHTIFDKLTQRLEVSFE